MKAMFMKQPIHKMMCAFLGLLVAFGAFASASSNDSSDTIQVRRIGSEYVQFEVCHGQNCHPLTGQTAIYKISDLEKRKEILLNGDPESRAFDKKIQNRLNILGPLGLAGMLASAKILMMIEQTAPNLGALYATTAAQFIMAVPVTLWFLYPFLIKQQRILHEQYRGQTLTQNLDGDDAEKSIFYFQDRVKILRESLAGLPTYNNCEAVMDFLTSVKK